MRILLLADTFNSLTQRVYAELTYRNHELSVELALSDEIIGEAVELYQPELIIAPFLTKIIPKRICCDHVCIIIHPGIKGDRGISSLDWAIMTEAKEWGVTAIQATTEVDAGQIWSSFNFQMRPDSKSCLYRTEVAQAAIKVILQTIERFESGEFVPEPLNYSREDVKGCWHPYMKQEVRAIDWTKDSVSTIVKKIRSADSRPGLLDTIDGEQYYLYGAHEEDLLQGTPGQIIAQRHGAICRGAVDGAVWISHLKKKKPGKSSACLKLPAAIVLGDKLKSIPEDPLPLFVPGNRKTFQEIWYEEKNQVGYLYFEFYKGAMSIDQCQRLTNAFCYARSRPTKVIVLMGGHDFWSNGFNLNIVEADDNPSDVSWRHINAMNHLVAAILTTNTHLTIAAMQGNAAAGGVMIALAADYVYARSGIVINPHYQLMGLYGSEYWTYLLPKRVGNKRAMELTASCLPVCTQLAQDIGLIDWAFGEHPISFRLSVLQKAEQIAKCPDYSEKLALKNQKRLQDEQIKPLKAYVTEELQQIHINLCGAEQLYHTARHQFVYKISPSQTPLYLAKHRSACQAIEH